MLRVQSSGDRVLGPLPTNGWPPHWGLRHWACSCDRDQPWLLPSEEMVKHNHLSHTVVSATEGEKWH